MKKKNLLGIIVFVVLTVFMNLQCFGATKERHHFIIDRTITSETTKFDVMYENYALEFHNYKDKELYVTRNGKVLFRKNCGGLGYMTVKIKKQPVGSVLKIYLKSKEGISNVKSIKVKKINSIIKEKKSSKIKAPTVKSKYGYRYIKAKKGDVVIIRNHKGKIIKKLKFSRSGSKKLHLTNYEEKGELYIYKVQGKKRSNYVLIPRMLFIFD